MTVPRTELRPILIVDDNLDDTFILCRLVQKSGARNPLQFATDGEDAVRLLGKTSADGDFKRPVAILTDLRMAGRDGFWLLEWIQQQPAFRNSLIAVITTSDQPADIRRAFDLGCAAYLRKYPTVDDCRALVDAANMFAAGQFPERLPGLARTYMGF